MNYFPNDSELLEMSLASFQHHMADLLSKYGQMTAEQRREFRAIGMSILTDEKQEAA